LTAHLRPPQQRRSRRTLDRIVRAALDLLAERGVEGTGVHDIVERAGSSVGSFYARFEGKEDLLLHLEETLWADAERRWSEAAAAGGWDELGLEALVHAVVGILLQAYRVGARQRRVLEGRRGRPGGSAQARRFHERLRADLRELLLAHAPRIGHPDPTLAVDLGLAVVVGAVREIQESDELRGALPTLDDDALVAELARVYLGYLGSGPAGPDEPPPVEFFEIWE
jgi:AcrR family transcriptional regulator